jgi:hypothetical protein
MGAEGHLSAFKQGGRMREEYPVHWEDHLDGQLKHHWVTNKEEGGTIDNSADISRFVRKIYFNIL